MQWWANFKRIPQNSLLWRKKPCKNLLVRSNKGKTTHTKNAHNFSSLSRIGSMFFVCIRVETNYEITNNILCNIFYCCNLQLISLLVSLFIIALEKKNVVFIVWRHCVILGQKFKWIKMKITFTLLSNCTILGHK